MEAMDSWEMGLTLVSFIYTFSICFPFQINFNLGCLILILCATGMVLAQAITQINESHLSYHFPILYPCLEKSTTSNAIVARVVTLEQIDPLDESEIQKV